VRAISNYLLTTTKLILPSHTKTIHTAYFKLVKYILTGRDARTTRVLEYSFIPYLVAKCCN